MYLISSMNRWYFLMRWEQVERLLVCAGKQAMRLMIRLGEKIRR
ncbi:TPA: hypothetical protein ACIEC1_001372 [Enterococcus faecium]